MQLAALAFVIAFASYASQLSDATTASGLKEALRVATERAVQETSKPGGFLDDPKIRIPLPGKLDGMATALRAVGKGAQVDEPDGARNRAAGGAAGKRDADGCRASH